MHLWFQGCFVRGRIKDTCGLQGEGMKVVTVTSILYRSTFAKAPLRCPVECWCADSSGICLGCLHWKSSKPEENTGKQHEVVQAFCSFWTQDSRGSSMMRGLQVSKMKCGIPSFALNSLRFFEIVLLKLHISHILSSSCIGLFSARSLRDWSQNLADCRLRLKGPRASCSTNCITMMMAMLQQHD